jgi:hypothetical protein
MWHDLKFVAGSLGLNEHDLTAFARQNKDRYGILIDEDNIKVATWNVDTFVKDFKRNRMSISITERRIK